MIKKSIAALIVVVLIVSTNLAEISLINDMQRIGINKVEADTNNTIIINIPDSGDSETRAQSKTITIPNLKKVLSITTDTGTVGYSVNKEQITINVSEGNVIRSKTTYEFLGYYSYSTFYGPTFSKGSQARAFGEANPYYQGGTYTGEIATWSDPSEACPIYQIATPIYGYVTRNYYCYKVTLNYAVNTPPALSITSPVAAGVYAGNVLNLQGNVNDADTGDILTTKYNIDGGSTRSVLGTVTTSGAFPNTSINIESLSEGNHTINVWVEDNYGKSSAISTVPFIIDRTPPSIGNVYINTTENSINISGLATDNLSLDNLSYQFTVGENSPSGWMRDTSYGQGGLTPNTSYTVKFETRDQGGNIASKVHGVYTKAIKPSVMLDDPTSTTLNINIIDNNPTGTLYQISVNDGFHYVTDEGSLTTSPEWLTLPSKNIIVNGLMPDTAYTFQVKAKNADGIETSWSEPASKNTLIVQPAAPKNITAVQNGDSISITWDEVSSAIAYEIEVDGIVKDVGQNRIYTHKNLEIDSQHTYRVRAKNAAGVGDWSEMKTLRAISDIPAIPVNIQAEASNTEVTLTWDRVSSAQGYEIDDNGYIIDNGSLNTCLKSGLKPDSVYIYRVRAKNAMNTGEWSMPITVSTFSLDTPDNIVTSEEDQKIGIVWDKVEGAINYEIIANGQAYTVNDGTSFAHVGLSPETPYSYKIRAIGASGTSNWSEEINTVTLPMRPIKPEELSLSTSNNLITLTWKPIEGAVAYDVELDGIVIDNDTNTVYIHEALEQNTTHVYRVRAKNDAIEGNWSEPLSVTTLPDKLVIPENITITSDRSLVKMTWDKVIGAAGYDIEVDGVVVSQGKKTSYIHRRLTANSEHRYRIRAKSGTEFGSWSGEIINNSLLAQCKKNESVDLGLTSSNIMDFRKYTMTVTYDPKVLEVKDLCTLSANAELTAGKIEGTDVEIKEFTPGKIVFIVDKIVNLGETWTGIINSIKFNANATGGTPITYTVCTQPDEE